MKFLVVDDEATARVMVTVLLEDFGTVHEAADGEEALDKVGEAFSAGEPYDLICVDLSMPGLDGLELIEHLREVELSHEKPYHSRLIVVSASRYPQDIMDAFKKQADGYLTKPVNVNKMGKLLQEFSIL